MSPWAATEPPRAAGATAGRDHLLAALDRLDALLRLEVARRRCDPSAVEFNEYRGLYVSEEEIRQFCGEEARTDGRAADPPGDACGACDGLEPLLAALAGAGERVTRAAAAAREAGAVPPLDVLTERCGLTPFDADALLICLAPEIDARYEKLYAYLQDDVTRKRPTAGLILALLCGSREERVELRARLSAGAPLLGRGLLAWVAEDAPFPSRPLRVEDRVVEFLLGLGPLPETVAAPAAKGGEDRPAGGLDRLACKIAPVCDWDDILLPGECLAQLREICAHVRHHRQVFEVWGFGRKAVRGRGVSALFAGPSGTGKTLASEVVARELGLDLYRIDLACVVSKYIGETEKNLARVFREAEETRAVLFFDEADALFGKRSLVKDAHDRYANIEIDYLLQRMEEHAGVVFLASNLRKNIDEAFTRRLRFIVELPLPDEDLRRRLWRKLLPDGVPLRPDVDLDFLARRFKLAGGSIRNVALNAAFLAASNGGVVGMEHLLRATRREVQKSGQLCVPADFEPYSDLLEEER
jgi:hypothetical protein